MSNEFIPELAAIRSRANSRNLQAAKYGIGADPAITIEAEQLNVAVGLLERIGIHRRNVNHMVAQAAHFGANLPTHIATQIENERGTIATLINQAARYGVTVTPHVLDVNQPIIQTRVTQPLHQQSTPDQTIRTKLDQIETLINEIKTLI